jgi:putative hydrolase of the HAD superfamily
MIRFIYFDCMDTLIQLNIPSVEVYSRWAYQAACDLGLWDEASSFQNDWTLHRERLTADGSLREGTILGRIRDLLRERLERTGRSWPPQKVEKEALRIHEGFWTSYRSAAFVLPEVHPILERIQRERMLPLGVVSNFMVEGGIPSLLSEHALDRFFQVVLVSCEEGYRKPSEVIYRSAIRAAGVAPQEILFIGDNLLSDYQGPRALGMISLLYDRLRLHPEVEHRIESFSEIEGWLGD